MPGVMDIQHLLCHGEEHDNSPFLRTTTTIYSATANEQRQHQLPAPTTETVPVVLPPQTSRSSESFLLARQRTTTGTAHNLHPYSFIQQQQQQQQAPRKRRRAASETAAAGSHHSITTAAATGLVQTRTPWTPFEDVLLQRGFKEGLSWAMISSTYLPHRSRGCCWGRYKTLQSKLQRQHQQQEQQQAQAQMHEQKKNRPLLLQQQQPYVH